MVRGVGYGKTIPSASAILTQIRSLGWIVETFRVNGTVEVHAVHLACEWDPQIAPCNDGDGPGEEYRCARLFALAVGVKSADG